MWEYIYRSSLSWPRHLFEVSGQLHALAALPPGEKLPVSNGQKVGWAPEAVWMILGMFLCSILHRDIDYIEWRSSSVRPGKYRVPYIWKHSHHSISFKLNLTSTQCKSYVVLVDNNTNAVVKVFFLDFPIYFQSAYIHLNTISKLCDDKRAWVEECSVALLRDKRVKILCGYRE
jgi:hypothetical protein